MNKQSIYDAVGNVVGRDLTPGEIEAIAPTIDPDDVQSRRPFFDAVRQLLGRRFDSAEIDRIDMAFDLAAYPAPGASQ